MMISFVVFWICTFILTIVSSHEVDCSLPEYYYTCYDIIASIDTCAEIIDLVQVDCTGCGCDTSTSSSSSTTTSSNPIGKIDSYLRGQQKVTAKDLERIE